MTLLTSPGRVCCKGSSALQGLWRCPACQDLCNCSGATCSRYQKGLEPTEQLHHEAVGKGFKSVRSTQISSCIPVCHATM